MVFYDVEMPLRHGPVDEGLCLCRELRIIRRQRQCGAAHGKRLLSLSILLQHASHAQHGGRVALHARFQGRDFIFELSHQPRPAGIAAQQADFISE
jgi:hypothetical protein